MTRIALLATGGTIASRASSHGAVAADGADALAALAPAGVELVPVDVLRENSFNLSLAQLRRIVEAVGEALADASVDGVVVTHGTDTMEESAFLAQLVHADERPVVFTGAQLAADSVGGDGPRNLADAVAVATALESRGRGVLLSFAGEVFSAVGTTKRDSLAAAPFAHRLGPVARMVGGAARYGVGAANRAPLPPLTPLFDHVRVDQVLAYPGADDALLRAALAAGADGIVLVATGAGNPGRAFISAIEDAVAAGVPVVIASRTGSGAVLPIYGGGGAVDAERAGAVVAGDLPASQARLLLAALLAAPSAADRDSVGERYRAWAASV